MAPAAAGLMAPGAAGLVAPTAPGLIAPAGAGLSVTGTLAPGAASCPGGKFVAGDCAAAAGLVGACAAGLVPGAVTGCRPAGGGDCANETSANASEHAEMVSSVFIIEAGVL
jgi:hypothetical protein